MLAVSVLDEYQRGMTEETKQLLQAFSDTIKGDRYVVKRVTAPTYGFPVWIHCLQMLI